MDYTLLSRCIKQGGKHWASVKNIFDCGHGTSCWVLCGYNVWLCQQRKESLRLDSCFKIKQIRTKHGLHDLCLLNNKQNMNLMNRINKFYLLLALLGTVAGNSVQAQDLPEKRFFYPERVRYDQDCFTVEGEDIFILSAAFHYFRCPQELWKDRFQKIKEAGFNTVETYVPWNWHERNMPKDINDFSQCNFDDLKAWLKMAHEDFGLYTIVRPGPFICAEWAGGAYPRWLAKFCPDKYDTSFWLRSNHPEHTKWSQHWYKAVCQVFAPEQITRKPKGEKGIIMMQLENEYVYFGMESSKKIEFLRALSDVSIANGMDVPLFTCVTPEVRGSKDDVVGQLFDMDNQYVWWNMHEAKQRLEDLKKLQPNAPAFVCELQGGWFSTVGGGLSEDSYLDGRHARGMALMNMAGGGTGLNYYMFFGGTHFAGWGARRMTTSYDYGAPLKESGGVGEKYAAVKGIGEIVEKFGKQLARSTSVDFQTPANTENLTIGIREAKDGTKFLFFLNRDRQKAFDGTIELALKDGTSLPINCNLKPLDSKMLVLPKGKTTPATGNWYPKEQPLPARPSVLPAAIRVKEAYVQAEQFKGDWKKLESGISLPEIGINDCRYSMYRSKVKLTAKEAAEYGSLVCEMFTDDPLYVQVNGQVAERASTDEFDNTFMLANTLRTGENEVIAIYENRGHAHGYRPMEELSGMKRAGLGIKPSSIIPVEEWQVKNVTEAGNKSVPEHLKDQNGWEKIVLDQATIGNLATLQIAGLEKPKWPAAWVLQGKSGKAIYQTTIRLTPEMIADKKTVLEFGCIDDEGTLWVNGQKVASHNEWDKPFVVNIAQYVKPGDNKIAILVSNNSGAGGLLKGIRLQQELKIIRSLDWEVSADLGGVCQGLTGTSFSKKDWQTIALNTEIPLKRKGKKVIENDDNKRNGLLTWYRVEFDLPQQPAGTWIPWKAIVNATGSGYMWLNGHNIGRHWDEGPQREFFLPECWLNFGKKNVLVLGFRQTENSGSQLLGVEVAPYADDAEIRN